MPHERERRASNTIPIERMKRNRQEMTAEAIELPTVTAIWNKSVFLLGLCQRVHVCEKRLFLSLEVLHGHAR